MTLIWRDYLRTKNYKKMGEILPDGSIQGYFNSCPKCGKDMEVNIQGDSMGHECMDENLPIQQRVSKVKRSFCVCKKPKHNYPEMVWCDNCGFEIKD